jgi:uncharacterized RmlC-like cupin family protein
MKLFARISLVLFLVLLGGEAGAQEGQREQAPTQGREQGSGQRDSSYRGRPMPPKMPGTFTVIPAADLQSILAQPNGETALGVVDTPSGNYGAFILTYQPKVPQRGAPVIGLYHADVTLIYYVVDGTGSMALGGELENAKDTGPESRSAGVAGLTAEGVLKNYTVVKYAPGTVIIIPPGVPHQLGYENTSKSDFLIFRIDPKKTVKAK